MSWLPWRRRKSTPNTVRLVYDAARTTPSNEHLWPVLSLASADSVLSADTRRQIRARARAEAANNSYVRGIVDSIANYLIGDGPQLAPKSSSRSVNNWLTREFRAWARAVRLADKLRTMRMAQAVDGEAFAIKQHNPSLATPVKIDFRPIEADLVCDPWFAARPVTPQSADGIEYDALGNVVAYHIAASHPGDGAPLRWTRVAASRVLHLYQEQRPDQSRGVSELASSLHIWAMLRQYTMAVVSSAEIAARHAIVLKTTAPPDEIEDLTRSDFPRIRLSADAFTPLPLGYDAVQLKAEQPTSTYAETVKQMLCEACRCMGVPRNLASGDSSDSNFASGRLDHQAFLKKLEVERERVARIILDDLVREWLAEARLIPGYAPLLLDEAPAYEWAWPGVEHQDPQKESNAQLTRLTSLTSNLAIEYARTGRDWRAELTQIAQERELMRELGLVSPANVAATGEDADVSEE